MASSPLTILTEGAKVRSNQDGPDHRLQVNQNLLYERDFFGDTFVSAHLQRLQNGVFTDKNIHEEDTMHVTFAAITFVFHPSNSDAHRFKNAAIKIMARDGNGNLLRFLKYAPHVAYGRISSASLKWNFQLGASVGVTSGPATAKLTPSVGYEKDAVVGTFMKMQGSTRCAPTTKGDPIRKPDTMLVWSLEENSQQSAGMPGEFTFVFLVERLHPSKQLEKKQHLDDNRSIATTSTLNEANRASSTDGFRPKSRTPSPKPSSRSSSPNKLQNHLLARLLRRDSKHSSSGDNKSTQTTLIRQLEDTDLPEHIGQNEINTTPTPANLPKTSDVPASGSPSLIATDSTAASLEAKIGGDGVEEIKDEMISMLSVEVREVLQPSPFAYYEDVAHRRPIHGDYDEVFTPIRFSISITPQITNAIDKATALKLSEFDEAIIEGQVGQKFPTNLYDATMTPNTEVKYKNVMVDGLFNFAKLGGSFEDMIELPGQAVSTVEPIPESSKK